MHEKLLFRWYLPNLIFELDSLVEDFVVVDFYALADVQKLGDIESELLVMPTRLTDLSFLTTTVLERAIAMDGEHHCEAFLTT